MMNSNISGFYKLSIEERLKVVKEQTELTDEEISLLSKTGALAPELADRMIENVIGSMPLTLGVATNFQINGQDYLVPMAIEEPSVVAAASNSAITFSCTRDELCDCPRNTRDSRRSNSQCKGSGSRMGLTIECG